MNSAASNSSIVPLPRPRRAGPARYFQVATDARRAKVGELLRPPGRRRQWQAAEGRGAVEIWLICFRKHEFPVFSVPFCQCGSQLACYYAAVEERYASLHEVRSRSSRQRAVLPQLRTASATAPVAAGWQPTPAGRVRHVREHCRLPGYVLGWVTGIIFYIIDNRPYVRFHAAQSIVTFGGLHVVTVLAMISEWDLFSVASDGGVMPDGADSNLASWSLLTVLGFVTFILWIVCMIKAGTDSVSCFP